MDRPIRCTGSLNCLSAPESSRCARFPRLDIDRAAATMQSGRGREEFIQYFIAYAPVEAVLPAGSDLASVADVLSMSTNSRSLLDRCLIAPWCSRRGRGQSVVDQAFNRMSATSQQISCVNDRTRSQRIPRSRSPVPVKPAGEHVRKCIEISTCISSSLSLSEPYDVSCRTLFP